MKTSRAFTLLELVIVASIITIIAGLTLPVALSGWVIKKQIEKEDSVLAELQREIEASLESRDLDTTNISALSADIDASAHPTVFSTSTSPSYASITGYEWFSRIARARGYSVTAGQAVSKTSQPGLYDLIATAGDRPRLLVAAPPESDKQRYLLISVIGRDDELVLPPYTGTLAWFNAIWDTPWHRNDAILPATWTSALSAAQVTNWNTDSGGKSRLYRLRVVRITQRRHDVVINCLHPTDSAWVAYNTMANYTPGSSPIPASFSPASGANTLTGLLAGRVVKIWTGDTWANAKVAEVTVRERSGYAVQ